MSNNKYALVLSGGGFKGAFQLGVLQWLRQPENWKKVTGLDTPIHFDIVAGVSVGALNGVMSAMKEFEVLDSLWQDIISNGGNEIYESPFIDNRGKLKLDFNKIKQSLFPDFRLQAAGLLFKLVFSKKKFFKDLGDIIQVELTKGLPGLKSLATNNALMDKLRFHISQEKIPLDTKYLCGFVSLQDGRYHKVLSSEFPNNEEFCKGVLASSAMPVVWDPVKLIRTSRGGTVTVHDSVDGGLRNNSPLGDVIDYINEDVESEYHIIVINCSSGRVELADKKWNIASIALRSLMDIAMEEIFDNDIDVFLTINNLVSQASEQGAVLTKITGNGQRVPLRKFKCTIINPDPGILGDTLNTDPELMRLRIQHGIDKAGQALGTD